MAITFKVTIPPGSVLESELLTKSGRQRTHHLYLLAELGARMMPALAHTKSVDILQDEVSVKERHTEMPQKSHSVNASAELVNEQFKPVSPVTFNASDLLSIS
jgi:hypothetical protein